MELFDIISLTEMLIFTSGLQETGGNSAGGQTDQLYFMVENGLGFFLIINWVGTHLGENV